jgi:phage I-like protein
MTFKVGYWSELAAAQFDDSTRTTWIHALPLGEYDHPVYGKIKSTPERVQRLAANVNANVRGTQLDIDYDHKAKSGEAAGWVKEAQARENGLWVAVEWTRKGYKKVKEGAYKYFSPEFTDEWTHPKTQVVHKDVLFGGGITNRPFLKDIQPLNASELFTEQQNREESGMDPKKLRLLLGLPEDATEEQVTAATDAKIAEDAKAAEDAKKDPPGGDTKPEPLQIAAGEAALQEVIQLAEKSPAIKALVDAVTGLQHTVKVQGVALQFAEADSQVAKIAKLDDKHELSAAAQKQLREVLLASPSKQFSDNLASLIQGLGKEAIVVLGEKGGSENHGDADGQASTDKFNVEVKKLMEGENPMTYGDAVEKVSSTHPELFEGYRQESYSFRDGVVS